MANVCSFCVGFSLSGAIIYRGLPFLSFWNPTTSPSFSSGVFSDDIYLTCQPIDSEPLSFLLLARSSRIPLLLLPGSCFCSELRLLSTGSRRWLSCSMKVTSPSASHSSSPSSYDTCSLLFARSTPITSPIKYWPSPLQYTLQRLPTTFLGPRFFFFDSSDESSDASLEGLSCETALDIEEEGGTLSLSPLLLSDSRGSSSFSIITGGKLGTLFSSFSGTTSSITGAFFCSSPSVF
mmetsp:Transcript_20812/g.34001  ORF Transcript_20812/g.34001 Transcript_20812/m.34001 type:complete len:236 (-) Transcript_20812:682-1389(-)